MLKGQLGPVMGSISHPEKIKVKEMFIQGFQFFPILHFYANLEGFEPV